MIYERGDRRFAFSLFNDFPKIQTFQVASYLSTGKAPSLTDPSWPASLYGARESSHALRCPMRRHGSRPQEGQRGDNDLAHVAFGVACGSSASSDLHEFSQKRSQIDFTPFLSFDAEVHSGYIVEVATQVGLVADSRPHAEYRSAANLAFANRTTGSSRTGASEEPLIQPLPWLGEQSFGEAAR